MTLLDILDYSAVFVFALTGALAASRAQLDITGFIFLACLTAVGGGTIRDVLLDRNPVFWVADPSHIAVAAFAGVLVFLGAPRLVRRYDVLVWLDAVALSVAVTAGLSASISVGAGFTISIFMGVVTGCLGGLMRDVICNEVPLVLKQGELYATAALVGAAAGVTLHVLGAGELLINAAAILATLALRIGSIRFGWRLPTYRSRPPRVPRRHE